MLEVKKPDASGIKFPVGRKRKCDGSVVIFWKETRATIVLQGEAKADAGGTYDGLISCMNEDEWEPVDIHIYG
ncbi:hypothetical protein [Snodgrassella alvi]|uniref:hypothetical protein n=1 Tax=Snodgrassella alvi TaxID=1196083 RepID=UPI000C1E5AF1|nr:hypothetical protein [Snodgrassella alvi]PIT18254.1 hypothetical protein BGI33_01485 [Snodgrassella alvi]